METLAGVTFVQGIVAAVFVTVCVLLVLIILLQKGRGGGLSSTFGGGGGGSSAFGAKTGDVFTWITVALAGLYLLMAVVGNYVFTGPQTPATAVMPTPGTIPPTPQPQPAGTPTRGAVPVTTPPIQVPEAPPVDTTKTEPTPGSDATPAEPTPADADTAPSEPDPSRTQQTNPDESTTP